MGFKRTKKSISILLLTIMLINAFSFFGTLEVYALTDDDWEKFQEQLPEGTPRLEQKYNKYEFNATYWQQDDLIVYGTFSSVKREGIANDQDKYGEYRYLGFDKNGNPFSNEKFQNDAFDENKCWAERTWIEKPWEIPSLGIRRNDWSTESDYMEAINRMENVEGLDTYGWTPNNSGSYFGYVHVQSHPTLLDTGSGRVWHESSSGAIFYKTFTIPVLDHREEMIPIEVTTECLSNDFTIEEGENTVDMKIKVTAKVPDDDVYNEPYKKVLYYTRDDIKGWYIKLEYPDHKGDYAPVFWIPSDGTNTADYTFKFPLSRSEVYDGQAIRFTGIGRVIYHNSESDVNSANIEKTFTVEESDKELPPGIYITAPSEVNVNESYTVKVNPIVPEGEEIKTLKLERKIGIGDYENVPMSDNKATHSFPSEIGIEYKATIELDNGLTDTDSTIVTIVDKRAATATADVIVPEYAYEGNWFYVENENEFYFDGTSYSAVKADELGIGDSRFRFQDNTGYSLSSSEYDTDDFDHDEGGKVKFEEPGLYKIYLQARPKNGDKVSDTESIQILKCPHVKGEIRGFTKDDRKIILDFTSTVVRPDSPLVDSKTKVTIEDISTGEKVLVTNSSHPNSTHIKTNAMSDNQLEFLIKTATDKNFKATIEVEDSRGETDTEELEFTVKADKAPIPKITAKAEEIRNPDNNSKAEIVLEDDSYSEDGDYITREWQIAIDTDRDGSFTDETYKNITTLDGYQELSGKGNKKKVRFLKTGVGKVAIRLNIKETFGQATIDAFVTDNDRLTATTDKIIDIINIAPHVDFKLSSMEKKDVWFIAEGNKLAEINNHITDFKADLIENQVNVEANVATHQSIQEELLVGDSRINFTTGSDTEYSIGRSRLFDKYIILSHREDNDNNDEPREFWLTAYNFLTNTKVWESEKYERGAFPRILSDEQDDSIMVIYYQIAVNRYSVKIYDTNFNLLGTIPSVQLWYSNDFYIDKDDNIYMKTASSKTFKKYDKYGNYIFDFTFSSHLCKLGEDKAYCSAPARTYIYDLDTGQLERTVDLIYDDPWDGFEEFEYEIDAENNTLFYLAQKRKTETVWIPYIQDYVESTTYQMVYGAFSLSDGSQLYEHELPYNEDDMVGFHAETVSGRTYFIFPKVEKWLRRERHNFMIYDEQGNLTFCYTVDDDDYNLRDWPRYKEIFVNEEKIYIPYKRTAFWFLEFDTTTNTGRAGINFRSEIGSARDLVLYSEKYNRYFNIVIVNRSGMIGNHRIRNTLRYAYQKAIDSIDNWRSKAEKYIVPINFGTITLTNEQISEITSKVSAIFSFIGDSDSQEVGEEFATQTGGTFYKTSSIENGLDKLKNDITPNTDQEPVYEYYFTKDDVVDYNIFYTDYELDPSKRSQWRYVHTPKNDGLIVKNKQWLNEPIRQFDKDGTYRVQHRQIDNTGVTSYDKWSNVVEMTIYVDGEESDDPPPPPPTFEEEYTPVGAISLTGSQKQNRKLTLNLEFSDDNKYSLDTTSIQWTLAPVSGLNSSDIKKTATTGKSIDTLYKKAGQVKVIVTFKDIKGNEGTATTIFNIVEDANITGNITLEPVLYRDAKSKATQTVNVEVTSTDDYIETLKHYITYDSDNDGSFTDEKATELTAYENMREFTIEIITGVGDYKITSIVTEGFIEDTIPEYVSTTDYHSITLEETFKVDNIAPMYDIRTNKNIYLVGDEITYISNFTDTALNGDYTKGYFDVEKDKMGTFNAKYTQNRAYMPNQDSISAYHNTEMTELTKTLDRAGQYTIEAYAIDDPKKGDNGFSEFKRTSNTSTNTIIVHRPPVARADISVDNGQDFGENMYLEGAELTITDDSYDPDGYSVTSTISYKVGNGAYTAIISGDTITLTYGELVTVKVHTEDNWGATDIQLTTITVINDLNMQPDIQPNPVPASEEVTLTLTTNQNATTARAEMLGNNIELALTNETATEKTWEAQYTIPATTVDSTYTAQFYATSEGLVEIQKNTDFIVETPIELVGTINDKNIDAEVFAGEENSFKFYTSTYVSDVELTFMGVTYTSVDGEISLLGNNGTSKTWEISVSVPSSEVTEGDTGITTFIAILPSGEQESVDVHYKIITIKLEDLRIINIGDYNWKSYFTYEEEIKVKDMPIDRNKQGKGIKLGYKVLFEIDSKGLHQDGDTINIDVEYFALDRTNRVHEVDIYVENEKGDYIKLEDSEYRLLSKEIQLESKNRDVSEKETHNAIANTWRFGLFLPYTAKIVKRGEPLNLYTDNTFDYRLIVTLNIVGQKSTGGSFDYTSKEIEWGTSDGSTYGINKPSTFDLLNKGINHGEVFWYNLYETLLDDIQIDRRW